MMKTPVNLAEIDKASPDSDGVKHIDLESFLKARSLAVIMAEVEAKARARFGTRTRSTDTDGTSSDLP